RILIPMLAIRVWLLPSLPAATAASGSATIPAVMRTPSQARGLRENRQALTHAIATGSTCNITASIGLLQGMSISNRVLFDHNGNEFTLLVRAHLTQPRVAAYEPGRHASNVGASEACLWSSPLCCPPALTCGEPRCRPCEAHEE